jgi:hypothetical protein
MSVYRSRGFGDKFSRAAGNRANMAELTAALNVLSTFALIGALAFTGLQVRAANRVRAEQAALSITHHSRHPDRRMGTHSEYADPDSPDASADQIDALGVVIKEAVEQYGMRFETIGYMVFRGFVSVETIEQLLGALPSSCGCASNRGSSETANGHPVLGNMSGSNGWRSVWKTAIDIKTSHRLTFAMPIGGKPTPGQRHEPDSGWDWKGKMHPAIATASVVVVGVGKSLLVTPQAAAKRNHRYRTSWT